MRAYLLLLIVSFGLLGALAGHFSPSAKAERATGRPIDQHRVPVADLQPRDAVQFSRQEGAFELRRDDDGHFYADVKINGSTIHMLVDTGASAIALSRNDAQLAGVATSIGMNDVVGMGADGEVRGEFVKLDRVELGPLSADGLAAVVLSNGQQSLLGQSFLARFASVEIHGDTMVLR